MIPSLRNLRAPARSAMRGPLTTLCLAAVLGLVGATGAAAKIIEVGESEPQPAAACPDTSTCQAVGKVTGFQLQIGSLRNPFKIKQAGRIVAVTLNLPQPDAKQMKFFNSTFGGPPRLRVAILRPRKKKGVRYNYALTAQSELIPLTDYLGSVPTFPLLRSLAVRGADVVALSIETWMPAFAVGLAADNAWKSSRSAKSCDDVRRNAVHDKVGDARAYGCTYRTARLLYSVTEVTTPAKTTK